MWSLAFDHAEETEADIVVIEMDTYGGVLTDAKEIVDRIMDFKKPVWVYINSDAASAGALISIACDSIYMSPGSKQLEQQQLLMEAVKKRLININRICDQSCDQRRRKTDVIRR